MDAFRFVLNILYPFLLGGAIAFVLSVPMNFVERKLFTERKLPENIKENMPEGQSSDRSFRCDRASCNYHVRADSAACRDICQSRQEYPGFYPAAAGVGRSLVS